MTENLLLETLPKSRKDQSHLKNSGHQEDTEIQMSMMIMMMMQARADALAANSSSVQWKGSLSLLSL